MGADVSKSFVHLHTHSEYSILDGLSRIERLVQLAKEMGQPALAITDHGNLHGAVEFHRHATKAGIKPILGVEGYMAHTTIDSTEPAERLPFHLTLLARNEAGYRNLVSLISTAHLKGFYYRPRFDWELLERHAEGLIVLSGCLSGQLQSLLKDGDADGAKALVERFKGVFGKHYFLEIMFHNKVAPLAAVNRELVRLARECDVPLVATNDSHYTNRADARIHDLLLCIQTNSRTDDKDRMRLDGDSFYLRSSEEMRELCGELSEAADNTLAIADMVEPHNLITGELLSPSFKVPEGATSMGHLRELCRQGIAKRYGDQPAEEVTARLEYELGVIEETGFANYFLVCWDIFQFTNGQGILSAVRGSAAASLVLYALEVSQIDPLRYGLVFERFLNSERREMPDIDMDFPDDRRAEVIAYCGERYGADRVAQIVTFSRMGARAAIRDVARVMGHAKKGDEIARLVPERLGITLAAALEQTPELRALRDGEDTAYRDIVERAAVLEGTVRHASTHAAGVVISERPLTEVVPLQQPTGDHNSERAIPTTQYAQEDVASIGLLKMDFLGLRNLSVLHATIKAIAERHGVSIDLHNMDLDDKPTFELLAKGDTYGVFQLESAGMRNCISELKPNSVDDIAALIALYRPGPMEHIGEFTAAKHGKRAVAYPHPDLEQILKETYGVIVYQDQILLIARQFGGYTLGQADILRKAMGKKIPEVMARERVNFVEGALAKGYSKGDAERVFNLVEPFAGYAFNKAHSVSYALIGYWTAYMKTNYPLEYYNALLHSFGSDSNSVSRCVQAAQEAGITVLGPDINQSGTTFAIVEMEDGKTVIRYGISNIKNIGEGLAGELIKEREGDGPFTSLENFANRVEAGSLNSAALRGLTRSGALDSFGERAVLDRSEQDILSTIRMNTHSRNSNQTSLFGDAVPSISVPLATEGDGADPDEQMYGVWESEVLGRVVSQRAMERIMSDDQRILFSEIGERPDGDWIEINCIITARRQRSTRNGERFLVCRAQLHDGNIELLVWPGLLAETAAAWEVGSQLRIKGQTKRFQNEVAIEAREVLTPGFTKKEAPPAPAPVAPPPAAPKPAAAPAATPEQAPAAPAADE